MIIGKKEYIALSVSYIFVILSSIALIIHVSLDIKKNKQKQEVKKFAKALATHVASQDVFLQTRCFENDDLGEFKEICEKNNLLKDIRSLGNLRNERLNLPLLHSLALCGSSKITKYVLEEGLDVNQLNDDGENALFCAAKSAESSFYGFSSCADILIKNGIKINALNKRKENALCALFESYSAKGDALERLKFLLDIGVSPAPKDGEPLFCKLLQLGYRPSRDFDPFAGAAHFLLEKCNGLKNVVIFDLLTQIPYSLRYISDIHKACIECIELVLSKNPDLNVKNCDGETALQLAEKYEKSNHRGNGKFYAEAVKSIKKHIKDTKSPIYISMLKNIYLNNHLNPFDYQGFRKFLEELLEFGADPSDALFVLLDNPPGKSSEHRKCYTDVDYIECIKMVLKENPDLNVKDQYDRTPLEVAEMHENSGVYKASKLFAQVKKLITEQKNKDNQQKDSRPEILDPKKCASSQIKTLASISECDAQKNILPLSNTNNTRA